MIEFKTDSCVNCFNCNSTLLMKKKEKNEKGNVRLEYGFLYGV